MTPEEYRQHLIWAGSQKMPRTKTGLFTTPTHKLFSGIVPVTTLLAPITEPLPINAPFKTRALSHIQTCFPIVTFLLIILTHPVDAKLFPMVTLGFVETVIPPLNIYIIT